MGHHTSEVILKYVDQFSSGFQKTMQQIESGTLVSKKAIRSLNTTGTAMLRAGSTMFIPMALGIKKSLDAEIAYENAYAKVKTIANESQKPMEKVGKEMVEISKLYGQGMSDVADTFYQVISATVDTANAIDYVHVASRMSIGGFADMQTAVDGLTSSMAAYKKYGYDMYRIGDILAQTQVYGKTTINELSESLGQVLPYASNVGMAFEDLGTTMAVLTSNGLSTSMATITLKNAINSILNPSASAKKAFDRLGVSYGSNAFRDVSFGEYLEQLREAIGLSDEAKNKLDELMSREDVSDEELTSFYEKAGINIDNLLTMFKNIRGATAMLSLTGSIDKYKRFRVEMNEENSKGVLQKQADIMMKSPQMQFKILNENFNASLRQFGEKLMPKVNELMGKATDVLNKINSMSDEQISSIVDNVIKITAASGGLIVLGTIAKSLASIFTVVNVLWKPLSKVLFGTGVKEAGKATGKAATGGFLGTLSSKGLIGALGKVVPAALGFGIGTKLSEVKLADDTLFKGEPAYYELTEDDYKLLETLPKKDINNYNTVNNSESDVKYEEYNPRTNTWKTVYNDNSVVDKSVKTTKSTESNAKNTTIYITNLDVNGVDNLDQLVSELENVADGMR